MNLHETMIVLTGGLLLALAVLAGLVWVLASGTDRRSPDDREVIRAIRKWRAGR